MRTFLKQTSNAFIWLLITLIALEALLQLGAYVIKENAWRAKTHWLTGNVRILALGDSNTYGLYLPPEASYPSQLEKKWNAKHPELPIEIINLGYPGTNSFRLLANLPEILDTFKPDFVLLMIGFNDFWTPGEPSPKIPALSWIEKIQYHSRVYKLGYMVLQNFYFQKSIAKQQVDTGDRMLGGLAGVNFSGTEIKFLEQETGISLADPASAQKIMEKNPAIKTKFEHALQKIMDDRNKYHDKKDILNTVKYGDKTFSLGIMDGESARNSKQMEQNLSTMLIQFNEHNMRYILLNYPSNHGYYPAANRKIQKVATQTHSPFIDLGTTFTKDCRNNPDVCPELFFYDGHATAKGNELISATVIQNLEDFFHVTR